MNKELQLTVVILLILIIIGLTVHIGQPRYIGPTEYISTVRKFKKANAISPLTGKIHMSSL
jgi:hypothetical protein